ncbi:hypothetical protein [Roseobacter sp. S98]|uniref:hypothetical protein n=1 Tax=Roseobacter algicola (ex Choi et al. 2025) (nom. illeg.) TaxID=3092138 RepID=UPI0035C6DCEC
MTPQQHKSWLRVTAVIVGSFGPVFALGSFAATAEPARFTLDLLAWPPDGATTWTHPDTRFLSALAGGFLLGWGVLIWQLATHVYDTCPDGVRRAVLSSLLVWFVVDTAGSVASGNASNAFFNTLVLMVAAGPLWRPADAPAAT